MTSRRRNSRFGVSKYTSYKKYTATEDVSYLSHSSRSSFRSEQMSNRTTAKGGFSSSKEIVAGSETRNLPVFMAIQDYSPESGDSDSMPLEQGQIVEVLDGKNPSSWLVRTKARPSRTGWIPGSYFETPTEYYKRRRETREIAIESTMNEQEEAVFKRNQVYHDLLLSEENFVNELHHVIDNYVTVFDDPTTPDAIRHLKDQLSLNLGELYNFHANVLLKGLQYYSDDPGKVGQTFVRLERDFDHHVSYCRDLSTALKLLNESPAKPFFDHLSDDMEGGGRSFKEYLQLPKERMNQYQTYFKEFIKYTSQAELPTKGLQKALELTQSVPQRATDMAYIRNIFEYSGDTGKLGRLLRHDQFTVWDGEDCKGDSNDRCVFLFKSKLLITERIIDSDELSHDEDLNEPSEFRHLNKYDIHEHPLKDDVFILNPDESGSPAFCLKAVDQSASEFVRTAWIKDVRETKQKIGPEEGPPRKKIKSPPVISPSGSSASLYSGSSSLDWTTTGTTLDMQGTRVTRTQYGFRTLHESTAKMCLKVTGYPLPDISWYKDDQKLVEDERHTFYADEDGFFALTLDPVHVDDTGRYTCMATNEYGQASTSAFFRVVRLEKEPAKPQFVTNLKDLEIKEGDVANFECEVEGWPEPELVWLVDDQPLTSSHDFKLDYDGQMARLEIRDAQPEDTGTYTIRVKNELGMLESSAKLIVDADPDRNHVSPEFQAQIDDVDCEEGATVRFKAVVTGDPPPDVLWFSNGIPLSDSNNIDIISEDGICIVTIHDVTRHFDGIITCQAVNRLGTENCQGKLRVRVGPAPPNFDRCLEDVGVVEHQNVVFQVQVSGEPDPTVVWYLDGEQLNTDQDNVILESIDGGIHILRVNDVQPDKHDGAEVRCSACNLHGRADTCARLTVEAASESTVSSQAPTISYLEDQTVTWGEAASFNALVKGEPPPDVTWFINGSKVDRSSRGVAISTANWTHKLTLDSAEYASTIVCKAENLAGRFETKCQLLVVEPEPVKQPPEFVQPLRNTATQECNTAVFEVTVAGYPKPSLTWHLNGEKLTDDNNSVVIREFDGSSKLQLVNVRLNHAGEIMCRAENSCGTAETKAIFVVDKQQKAPVFDQSPGNVTVTKGESAVFSARAIAEPAPKYCWSLGGQKLSSLHYAVRIDEQDGVSTLTLDTTEFDGSTVSVVAENFVGDAETGAKLTVEAPKPKPIPSPNVKKPLKDITVTRGDSARFMAVIENADKITWFLNGEELGVDQIGVTISDDDDQYRLKLDSSRYQGSIMVRADNANGTAESRAELAVLEPIKTPEFTVELENICVQEGGEINAQICASNDPDKVDWSLNGKPLQHGVDGVYIKMDGAKSTLLIPAATKKMDGKLKVTVGNSAGQKESEAKITISPKSTIPEFLISPEDQIVIEDTNAIFKAAAKGEPQPKILWKLDTIFVDSNTLGVTVLDDEEASILNITPEHLNKYAGQITCIAKNEAGQVEKTIKLTVKIKETAPEFDKTPTDNCTVENESVKFRAIVTGKPIPSVRWYLDGKQVVDNVKFDEISGKTSVQFLRPQVTDSGRVTVKVENSVGSIEASANLTVEKKLEPPKFKSELDDKVVNEGHSVRFAVKVDGYPKPEVSWLINGKSVTQNSIPEGVKMSQQDEDEQAVLEMVNVKPDDAGEITCVARNSVGQTRKAARLKVNLVGDPPKFIRNLEDLVVNEPELVLMTAQLANVRPKPMISWRKDGQPLETGNGIKLISEPDDVEKMQIFESRIEHSGKFTVIAENHFGLVESSANLGVQKRRPMSKPNFLSQLAPISLTEGDTLTTSLLINGDPSPFAKWYINDQLVVATEDTELTAVDGVYSLTIRGVAVNMTGTISCVAYNKMGQVATSGRLAVVAPIPVEFETSLCDATCIEGDTLKLKAVLLGEPIPDVFWYINDKKLEQSAKIQIHDDKGTYTVTIKDITCDFSGTVLCKAVNEGGEATSQATLLVLPRGDPPDFVEWLSNVGVVEKTSVSHKVVFTGDPVPVLTWYMNNEMLIDTDNVVIKTDSHSSILTIKSFDPLLHVGKIICKAENDAGEVSCTASMFHRTSEMISESESEAIAEDLSMVIDDATEVGSGYDEDLPFERTPTPVNAPRFISKIRDAKTKRNHRAIFECIVPETKGIVCKWLKDGRQVELITRIRVKSRTLGGSITNELIIDEVMPEDAGNYMIVISNDSGEIACQASLVVLDDVEMKPPSETFQAPSKVEETRISPEFVEILHACETFIDGEIKLECKVVASPAPKIRWLKNGKEVVALLKNVTMDARVRIKSNPDGTQTLALHHAIAEDVGEYRCEATNDFGTAWTEAPLSIKSASSYELPTIEGIVPDFVEPIRAVEVVDGERAEFHCKIVGEPTPEIKWFRGSEQIEFNDRVQIAVLSDGTHILAIDNARQSDIDEYRCEASNKWGVVWSDATLGVKVPASIEPEPVEHIAPDVIHPLEAIDAAEGEAVAFECKIVGEPEPDICWFKDDAEIEQNHHFKMDKFTDGTARLTISSIANVDAGQYRCQAVNTVGVAQTVAPLTLHTALEMEVENAEELGPEFVQELHPVKADEGTIAAFECKVVGEPKPLVKWFKDGKKLMEDEPNMAIESTDDGTHRLLLSRAQAEDQGNYRCEATNVAGSMSSKAPLTVLVAPLEPLPEMLIPLQDCRVKEGFTAALECSIAGHLDTVIWYSNGQEIQPDDRLKTETFMDGRQKLTILDTIVSDMGTYCVVAANKAGKVKTQADLSVEPILKLKTGLQNQTLERGLRLILSVQVEGKPKSVKWYKGHEELAGTTLRKLTKVSETQFELVVDSVELVDQGRYLVMLSTDSDSVESTANVTVKDKLIEPSFKKGLNDQTVPRGSLLELQVEVEGNPTQVNWFKDGQSIDETKAKIEDIGNGIYKLTIPETLDDNTGLYSVSIENEAGKAKSRADVIVESPPPQFIQGLKDLLVNVGEEAMFSVEASGRPKTVKWYRNGKEVKRDDRIQLKEEDLKFHLVIIKTELADSGEIKVVLGNNLGENESSASLTVKKKDVQMPKITKGLSDQILPKGTELVLSIQIEGEPTQVNWFKDGQSIDETKAKIEDIGNGIYKLTIPETLDDDTGLYSVSIENEAGKAKSRADVIVESPPPQFIQGLKDLLVNVGEEAMFSVEASGRPKTVKWYRNGKEVKRDDRIQLKEEDLKFHLVIIKTELADSGEIKVVLGNNLGENESSASLTVKKKDVQMPKITKGLSDQILPKGTELVLSIQIEGEPTQVNWFKDGQSIDETKTKIEDIGNGIYKLTIPETLDDDTGLYSVSIENEAGKAKSRADVIVESPPPQFIQGLKDLLVNVGEEAMFSVEASGRPKTIKWYRNGKEVKRDDRIQLKEEDLKFHLVIIKTELADSGEIKVVLGNNLGENESSASLTVKKKDVQMPKITKGLSDQILPKGTELVLSVQIEGEPTQVKWFKDGYEIGPAEATIEKIDASIHQLRIQAVELNDTGKYSFEVSNETGSAISSGDIDVDEAPEIVKPLKNKTVNLDDDLVLEVEVNTPPRVVKWYKNGREITPDNRFKLGKVGDKKLQLAIDKANDTDQAIYKVVLSNEAGSCDSQASLTVVIPEEKIRPKFVIPLNGTMAEQGKNAVFEIKIRGKPDPDLAWFRDDIPLEHEDRVEIDDLGDGRYRLTIADTLLSDSGIVSCTATNSFGQDQCSATLKIRETKPKKTEEEQNYPPRWNVPLWDRRIPEHRKMSVECHVDAKPLAEIKWFKDTQELASENRVHIGNSQDGKCRLSIDDFATEDTGVYRCVATNPFGAVDTHAGLSVDVTSEPRLGISDEYAPRFQPGLDDQRTTVGSGTIILSCTVDGNPAPIVTWYKNGLPVKLDGRIKAEHDIKTGKCRLVINDVDARDAGAYRCVATNDHGTTNTACSLTVKKEKVESKKQGREPHFMKSLTDLWPDRGSELLLKCQVFGDPTPEIRWYKNATLMKTGGRNTVEFDGQDGWCCLTIKDCGMADEGVFRCEAENAHGQDKTQATVHVQVGLDKVEKREMDEGETPKFIIVLKDMTVSLDSTIELSCKVTGKPEPTVKWSKDGTSLQENSRLISESDSGRHKLTISHSTVHDEGTYRCVANNESGSATTKSFVHLDGTYRVIATNSLGSAHDKSKATVKPQTCLEPDSEKVPIGIDYSANRAPRLIIPLESGKIVEGQPVLLMCKFAGDPEPSLKWFKDGDRIYPYERVRMVVDDDNGARLIVENAGKSDAGCYRCVAGNDFGTARTSAEISVQVKEKKSVSLDGELKTGNAPGFSTPLTIRRVDCGQMATFECVAYGNPFPRIKWIKDGVDLDSKDNIFWSDREDGAQILTVHDVDTNFEGYYRCVASNQYGTASTKAELVVIDTGRKKQMDSRIKDEELPPEESKPRFRRGLHSIAAHERDTIEMQVCAVGWPTPTVKWFRNNEELISLGLDDRPLIWTDDIGLHHCVILNASTDDEAEYSVEAVNKLGMARSEGSVSVIVSGLTADVHDHLLAHPPGFIRQLKNKHVFTRMPIVLDCLIVGASQVDWFHNGKKIIPDGTRVKIQVAGGGSHALVILNATMEDMGGYMAMARNTHGTTTSSAILDVATPYLDGIKFDGSCDVTPYLTEEYGFKKIHYSKLPTPPNRGPFIKEVTGHYLTLSWIPTKRAPPRYPQVTYVIEIRECPVKQWTLVGEGRMNRLFVSAYQTLAPIIQLEYNIPEPVCKVRNLELGRSYQFRVRAENIYGVSEPSPASPPSRLMAPPQPVLDSNKRVIPLFDPYGYTELAFEKAYADRYGALLCMHTLALRTPDHHSACAPWFAPGSPGKLYCPENGVLALTLNVSGFPDPDIRWKFRGLDVNVEDPLSRMTISTLRGAETTLTVLGFTRNDVGQFQCLAQNQYGEAQQNVLVEMAQRPHFLQPLIDRTYSDGKPLKLNVRVEGYPFPTLKWMKEWHPLVESSRVSITSDGPYLVSLNISNPIWADSGIYSCMAINEAGTATSSCSVTVEAEGDYNDVELPRRKVMLTPFKVREIYEIGEEVEKDSHGTVHRAVEKATGRLLLARRVDPNRVANLHREIALRNVLWHENIAAMYDAIIDRDAGWLFYEFAPTSLLDQLTTVDIVSEHRVAQFITQLLSALKKLHDNKIVHLDLRPETILVKNDQIKLTDFDQSRRLIKGRPSFGLVGSPEFVAPEIVAKRPVTLAADLWSVGVLSYVLLSGLSPFLGDNDDQTLSNVTNGRFSFEHSQFGTISEDAKKFIVALLNADSSLRSTVFDALNHPWLQKMSQHEGPSLTTNGLKEFKYRHKWVERRVFVQQSAVDDVITRLPEHKLDSPEQQLFQRHPPSSVVGVKPLVSEHRSPDYSYDHFKIVASPPYLKPDISPQERAERLRIRLENARNEGIRAANIDDWTAGQERTRHPDQFVIPSFKSKQQVEMPPVTIDRRRRSIQEEMKNRILSAISEEANSQADDHLDPAIMDKSSMPKSLDSGSTTPKAIDYSGEIETESGNGPSMKSTAGESTLVAKSTSISTDNSVNFPASRPLEHSSDRHSDSIVPLFQPLTVEIVDPVAVYYGHAVDSNPTVPVGVPIMIESIKSNGISPMADRTTGQSGVSPTTLHLYSGVKSPVILSPAKERQLKVVIATKRGTVSHLPGPETTVDLPCVDRPKPMHVRCAVEHRDDLEKYRPKNFYRDDRDYQATSDEFSWESRYQIGPETYLLASRAPSFNARVRDYRRELWGDGAPYVTQGLLGFRNQDITVRERRRFTDVIKEDANIAKSVLSLESQLKMSMHGVIKRNIDEIGAIPVPGSFNQANELVPIFKTRLQHANCTETSESAVFQCTVLSFPSAEITWFCNDSVIDNDTRRLCSFDDKQNIAKLSIKNPTFVDCGVYVCLAENEHGQSRCAARLKLGDLPEPAGRPTVELASDTELFIVWEVPNIVNGFEILAYRLEYRLVGESHLPPCRWRTIGEQIDDEAVIVRHLEPLGIYQFRVAARNMFGWGPVSLMSRIVRTHCRGAPKLKTDLLKQTTRLNVLSMMGDLGEIREEDDSADVDISIDQVILNTVDDPLDRFELGVELYRGRFSWIRIATDSQNEANGHCVVKIGVFDGLQKEMTLLKEAEHEHVVKLVASYRRDDFMLLFTERLHETIFERFTFRDQYNEDQIARSIGQLASAIQWLQFKGIVHLDVRPENLLFTGKRNWNLKLIDFGSAVRLTPEAMNPAIELNEDIEFTAPELLQPKKEHRLVSSQCDMWGLGIVTFCLLSGFHPYSSDDDYMAEIQENILGMKCDPSLIYTQASQESLRFVTWALKKMPARRMNPEEALQHRWLSFDKLMSRRRENIKYPANRLVKLRKRLDINVSKHSIGDNDRLLLAFGR